MITKNILKIYFFIIYLIFFFWVKLSFAADAIPVIVEIEPNNIPQQALNFSAPAILSGSMRGSDQDAYLWHISDADALKLWDITLHGIPEALTGVSIVRVKTGQDPNDPSKTDAVLAFEKLLTFGIRDGSRPVVKRNLLMPAGDYIVGFFQAGAGDKASTKKGFIKTPNITNVLNDVGEVSDNKETTPSNSYRLFIEPGLKTSFKKPKSKQTRKNAFKLKLGRSNATVTKGSSWYSIKVDEKRAKSTWSISGEVMLENKLTMTLYNEKKEVLGTAKTDKYGHYELPNLSLAVGKYYVELKDKSKDPTARNIRITETGLVSDTNEREANNSWARANIIKLTEPFKAKVDKKKESDYFKFNITEEEQKDTFSLTLDSPSLKYIELCLLDVKGKSRSCRKGKPPLVLDALNLNADTHGLNVYGSNEIGDYTITKTILGKPKSTQELEPNDKVNDASAFGKKRIIKGRLNPQDTDYFTLNVTKKPQLWRLQAIGENLLDLKYISQSGASTKVRANGNSKRLRLDNLYLLPGKHNFSLTARKDTKYVLRAIPLGPPSPSVEREPNNTLGTAQKIKLNTVKTGLLAELTDGDYHRFHLAAKQEIQLELAIPPDGNFNVTLYMEGQEIKQFRSLTKTIKRRLKLEPGDYHIHLGANTASEAEYELSLKQEIGFPQQSDIEPNGSPALANDIPPSWVLSGRVGDSYYSYDFYRIPKLKKPLLIRVNNNKSATSIGIYDKNKVKVTDFKKVDSNILEATLPADKELYFFVWGKKEYQYDITFNSDEINIKPPLSKLPLKMEITSPVDDFSVAAYRNVIQEISLEATIENQGSVDVEVELEAITTDDKWKVNIDSIKNTIATGQILTVPLKVSVMPDAWPDTPVLLKLIARNNEENKASVTSYTLNAKRFIAPKKPQFTFKPPRSLQGSINVAASSLGAKLLSKANSDSYLIDQIVDNNYYFYTQKSKDTGEGKAQPVIQLAGDQASEVIGFSFHTFVIPYKWGYANKVKVELSNDGKEYTTAIVAELSANSEEQFFALDNPVSAKYARLTFVDSPSVHIVLSEWKVLTKPNNINTLVKDYQNIASPTLGGHIVWFEPPQPGYSYYKTLLTKKEDAINIRTNRGQIQWVIGFKHNRAALIDSINWKDKKEIKNQRFVNTQVFTSIDSQLGPWKEMGSYNLSESGNTEIKLEKPIWARYLKFVGEPHAKHHKNSRVYTPDQIEVFESTESKLSILGEWGHNSSKGPYEIAYPPIISTQENYKPDHVTKDKAKSLGQNQSDNSVVRLGKYENWYRITVPEGHNSISLSLKGEPSIGAKAVVFDSNDKELAWSKQKDTLKQTDYEAYVPEGEYYIRVEEPPRSVIFTWDTSGSTNPVRPIIQQAVLNYIADVKPKIDEAQMLPFGGSFLSQRWLDQPYMLQSILNDYNGAGDSSAAETALVRASEKMRDRPGKKIIVVITDAATSSDSALWKTLTEVRPRIIAIGVSSKGNLVPDPNSEQDLLEDWAYSSNGYYEYAESVGAVERAFDRASSKIRQPVSYQITANTELKEAPKPGFLKVVSTSKEKSAITLDLPAPTIEVILDASGSMFSPMGKLRRYQVARNVLVDLVEKQLPKNANFGLRVFGHKESGSCRTDLEIPINKLNRKKAIQKIKKIAPKSYAKTPIAASLLAVAGDLKKMKGEKTLLLITDGKETCEGDPEKAITKLKESGIDTTVNIIGFAINDNALEAKFRRWAKSGGGDYQQAMDADALQESIKKLSARKFTLIKADGEIQGTYYTDGEAIELAVGEYQIDFGNELNKKITIKQNETATVKVGK